MCRWLEMAEWPFVPWECKKINTLVKYLLIHSVFLSVCVCVCACFATVVEGQKLSKMNRREWEWFRCWFSLLCVCPFIGKLGKTRFHSLCWDEKCYASSKWKRGEHLSDLKKWLCFGQCVRVSVCVCMCFFSFGPNISFWKKKNFDKGINLMWRCRN